MLAYPGEGQVDEVREELATGDKKAVGANKSTTNFSWRSFRDVERGCH